MEYKNNAKDDAMTFLGPRSRTAAEVKKRLREKGYDQDAVEEAMEFLLDCHLVDDDAYCDDFIQKEMEKGRGPKRISQSLSEKGIEGELVQMKLEDWFDRQTEKKYALAVARKLWAKNGAALTADEDSDGEELNWEENQARRKARDKELARVARKLEYQGFRSGVIFDVLNQLK